MAVARPFAEVRLPKVSPRPMPRVSMVRVRQPLGRHETAVVRLHSTTVSRRIQRDAPVEIRWGRGGRDAVFVGYVNRVQRKKERGADHITVTCVGSSSSLSSTRNRAWRGSLESVVTEIARLNRHRALVEPSTTVLSLNQAGMSDWELLQDVAERTGRILYARGLRIVLCSRDYWLKDRASAPRLRNATIEVDAPSFDPRRPDTITTQGMDRSGQVFTSMPAGGSKTVRAVSGGIVVRSSADLKELSDAKRELARWSLRATFDARGDARVGQGKPVYLQAKDARYAGYWLVDEVVHTVEEAQYRIKVVAVADALKGVVRDVPPTGVLPLKREPALLPTLMRAVAVLDPESPVPSDLDAFDNALEDASTLMIEVPEPPGDTWGFESQDLGLLEEDELDTDFLPTTAASTTPLAEGNTVETRASDSTVEVDDPSVMLELDDAALASEIDMGSPDGGSTTITLED